MTYYDIYNKYREKFTEYCKVKLNKDGGLYDYMDDAQASILKAYSRLRTRDLFNSNKYKGLLRISEHKADKLASICGSVTDWEYDGSVDTGCFGGGICTLGHTLRYEHWAKSRSTGKEIVFGSKCVSDFFNVEEYIIKAIDSTRAEVSEELKFITFINDNGLNKAYAKALYGDLAEMCKDENVNNKLNELLGDSYAEIVYYCISLGVPLPKYLIMKIDDLRQWYKKDYTVYIKEKHLKDLLTGDNNELLKQYELIKSGNAVVCSINKMIDSGAIFDYTDVLMIKSLEISLMLQNNSKLLESFNSNISVELLTTKVKRYVVSNGKTKRVATKDEVDNCCRGLIDESEYFFKKPETRDALSKLKYCFEVNEKLERELKVGNKEYLRFICDTKAGISKGIKLYEEFKDLMDKYVSSYSTEMQYGKVTDVIPELKEIYDIGYVYNYLKYEYSGEKSDIVESILRYNTARNSLSVKQGIVLRKFFDSVHEDKCNKNEYTSTDTHIKSIVYSNATDGIDKKWSVLLLDADDKMVYGFCSVIDENFNTDNMSKFDLSDVKVAYTFIYNRGDEDMLSMALGVSTKIKCVSLCKDITKLIMCNGDLNGTPSIKCVKYKDMETYLKMSTEEYDSIIRDVSDRTLKGLDSYFFKTSIRIAVLLGKINTIRNEVE